MTQRILISGSTGFVGRNLVDFFSKKNFEVFQLIRKKDGQRSVFWDPQKKLIDQEKIKNFDVIIHLAGEPLVGFWTKSKKQKIYKSRVNSTEFLTEVLKRLNSPPKIFITASAIGYYDHKSNSVFTEDASPGNSFLSKVCEAWELQSNKMESSKVVNLRFGHILGKKGGILPKLKLLHKLWLGGKVGDGKQYISWIAIDDVTRIVDFVINNDKINGPINVTTPNFTTQEELGKAISTMLNKPFFFHIPKFFLKIILGKQADEMMLSSIRAFPKKLKDFNFQFEYENLQDALKQYIST